MTPRRIQGFTILIVTALSLAMGLSACGKPAQQVDATPATSSIAKQKAPKVSHPLNADAVLKSPCSALTSVQVNAAGLAGTTPSNVTKAAGAGCSWDNSQAGTELAIAWQNKNTVGLDVLYGRRSEQKYFQEVNVDGYPGVFADSLDERPSGICSFHVGVSDKLAFFAEVQTQGNPPKSQSCAIAQKAASAVVENLKNAGGQ